MELLRGQEVAAQMIVEWLLTYGLIGLAVASTAAAGVLLWRVRRARQAQAAAEALARDAAEAAPLSPKRVHRLGLRLQAISRLIPSRSSLTYRDFPAISAAATIEAWLLQNKPFNALAAARMAVRDNPRDWRARLHLARTLLYCDEVEEAARELVRARLLGDASPAQDYLEARIRLAAAELGLGGDDLAPEELEQRRQVESIHALELLVSVLERDPRFGDAAFHAALLAEQVGLQEEARQILGQIEPLMESSPERAVFEEARRRLN